MRKWKKHLRSWRRPVIKAAFLYRRESPCTTSYLNCARRNWKLRLHNIQQRQNRHLRCDFLRKGKVTLNSSRPNVLLSFSHSVDVPFFFAIASSASSQVYGWRQLRHCEDTWHELVFLMFFSGIRFEATTSLQGHLAWACIFSVFFIAVKCGLLRRY